MPNHRIDATTDMNILADLALGLPHRKIAERYNVSQSYVSKLNTGRKKTNVYVIGEDRAYEDKDPVDAFLLARIEYHTQKAYMYQTILNRLKENKNE